MVTATIQNRKPLFRSRKAAELLVGVLEQLRGELGFALLGYAVMPDHLHLILIPDSAAGLARIMQFVKGRFARLWNERRGSRGSVWQPRYYESAVRTEAQLARWLDYVNYNPVRAGLAGSPEEYPYCSAGGRLATDLDAYLGGRWTGRAEARPSGEGESLRGEQRQTIIV
jgi:REP element-mobilizing transposase RayT